MSKMQDIATEVTEKAVAVHDWLRWEIGILTITAYMMSGMVGYVVLCQTLESGDVASWLRNFAGILYAIVLVYWGFRLTLRLTNWAAEIDKARIVDTSRQGEVKLKED